VEEASLLVPTELGRGGFESLLEHDSKAPALVYLLGLAHSQLGGDRQDDANASGFKVPLLFGGSSKEGIVAGHYQVLLLRPYSRHPSGLTPSAERAFSWNPPDPI
jgi:hypothetical protein